MFLLTKLASLAASHPYLTGFIVLVAVYNYIFNRGPKCTLPGPYGLPVVGYLPFLLPRPYEAFMKLAEKYGPIFQVKVGPHNMVIISSLEIGNEAFSSDLAFHGRGDYFSIKLFQKISTSIFTFRSANDAWRFLRKTASRSLGLFASSRNSKLESVVQEAQDHFDSTMDQHLETPFCPQQLVLETVATVIGSILFGFKFDINHPLVQGLAGATKEFSDFLSIAGVFDNVPFPDYFFARFVKNFIHRTQTINQITSEFTAKHKYEGTEEEVRDVADALYKASEHLSQDDLSKAGVDRSHVRRINSDLFGAGFATTSDSFHWFLNYMAVNQNVQLKCQQEIDTYLAGRHVTLGDKGKIPYIEATITEMFRLISLTPMGLPHSMLRDTVFRGYLIPKGTNVYLNMYAIHHNEQEFPEPERMRPERFLRDDGTFDVEKSMKIVLFGIGKRRCVGETLARQELFMLFVSTLQKYSVRLAPGQKVNFSAGDYGFTRIPHNLDLVFSHR